MLAWKVAQSKLCGQPLHSACGNAGTALCRTDVNIAATDIAAVKQFALDKQVELVVVGPEEPLLKRYCRCIQE